MGSKNAIFGLLCSVLTTAGIVHAASDELAPVKIQMTTSAQYPSLWKASTHSQYFAIDGTRPAEGNAYAFGRVRVFMENLGLDYTAAPEWMITARGQYLSNDYLLLARGREYREESSGLGDSALGVSHPLVVSAGFRMVGDFGVSLPTGSIDQANRFVQGARYKYFMQLGSGTYDGNLGLTSVYSLSPVRMGTRVSSVVRTGENHNHYRLGNVYRGDAWLDYPVSYGLTPRLTSYYRQRKAMSGGDNTIPRSATEFYYHDQIDWAVNVALKFEQKLVGTLALTSELGVPVAQGMQNVDNVVISTRYFAALNIAGQF